MPQSAAPCVTDALTVWATQLEVSEETFMWQYENKWLAVVNVVPHSTDCLNKILQSTWEASTNSSDSIFCTQINNQ